jgi:hypothetical protein
VSNILFANNASALLAASIDDDDTVIQVAAGFGVLFPSPTGSQYFIATLENNSGEIELVRVTSRTGDNLTVLRGQEGSTAQAFVLNVTRVELRTTKGVMEGLLQLSGGAMSGDIDMDGNDIVDAILTGATVISGGQTVGTAIRGLINISTNELAVPTNGTSRATAGGIPILVNTDDLIPLLDVAGVITLSSATIGVRIPGGAYLRIADSSDADFLQAHHDGTDFNFAFTGTAEVNFNALLNLTAALRMNDNLLITPVLQDFAIDKQAVTATSSTTIDYVSGSYVELTLGTNIGTLALSNPPANTAVGTLRIKIIHSGASRTITWPASVKWPAAGIAPTLSGTDGAIDFVDLWTDDAGTTWYGAFNTDWQ